MFLSWWMLIILALFWLISLTVHGRISFQTGATAVVAGLAEAGYIKLKDEGEIIGLCNRDHDEWEDQ